MPDMRPGAVPAIPSWQVDILMRGNLLISQEQAFKGWIASRGGILARTLKEHEDIIWSAQLKTRGASALLVYNWALIKLQELCPGDRIDAIKLGVKRLLP